ncbi:MAG: PPC domain-containing protein [Verrucomicrobiota bacterium]
MKFRLRFSLNTATSGMLVWFPLFALHLCAQQQTSPHIGYVYPAGGRPGATFEVVVGGQLLTGPTNVFIGEGVQGRVVDYNRPLNPNQFNALRDEFRELQEKKRASRTRGSTNAWSSTNEQRMAEIRKVVLKSAPNRQGHPAIAETVTVEITISTGAKPGDRELRLLSANGLSNPLKFRIDQLPESGHAPAKAANPDLDRFRRQLGERISPSPAKSELRVTLPATVNGQIMPGESDRIRFTARQGQSIVASVRARDLIPYVADAVPGWFQAALSLSDANGRELAYDDDYRFHADPVIQFVIPRDGEYCVEIRDALYRGREDFVYRLSIGELPFLTSLFPLGAPCGTSTTVQLMGWNLPTNRWTATAENAETATRLVAIARPELISNALPFARDALPERMEKEPNDAAAMAMNVELPLIVNGRIERAGDRDHFQFHGRAGEEIVIEVLARRLESPLDSTIQLIDASATVIADNDDFEDKGSGLNTHHADSYLRVRLPADGAYQVVLADAQNHGGLEYGYRLRISPPRPDFALRVTPSSLNASGSAIVPMTIYAIRKDGFTNEIQLRLASPLEGFQLSGARVPAGQDKINLTLTLPAWRAPRSLNLSLEGQASIHGQPIVRPVVPAEDLMQAFAYRHLVPVQELKLAFLPRPAGRGSGAVKILSDVPLKIPAGRSAHVKIAFPSAVVPENLQVELSEPPEGITIEKTFILRDGAQIQFQCDGRKAQPGVEGNLILKAYAMRASATPRVAAGTARRRVPLGTLPAIPFEIVDY